MSTHYGFVRPLSAGIRCRCPRCGEGKLYDGFLKVAEGCSICDLRLAHEDAGDGPAVFIILIYGMVMTVLAVIIEFSYEPPLWVHLLIFVPLVMGGSALLLRPFKGVMIALQYKYRIGGFENEPDSLGSG